MALAGEEQPLAETSGEIRLERGDARLVDTLVARRARREALDLADDRAAARRPACLARTTPGTRAAHQSIARRPSSTTRGGALSPSQNGASMPPASQEALPPSSGERSTSVTLAPRSASVVRSQGRDARADDRRAHRHSAAFT